MSNNSSGGDFGCGFFLAIVLLLVAGYVVMNTDNPARDHVRKKAFDLSIDHVKSKVFGK